MIVPLDHIEEGLSINIAGSDNSLLEITDEEVLEYGESKIQLKEGCTYEYKISNENYAINDTNGIVTTSKFNKHCGTISPNIYVGKLTIQLQHSNGIDKGAFTIDVQSVKSDYRKDYRFMLESITEKCTELIMQIDSPVSQRFETDYEGDSRTIYQRFSFVKSIIDSIEFEEAIHKIISNPTTKWQSDTEEKDIRNVRRFGQKTIKQLLSKSNRTALEEDHFLHREYGIQSVPLKIESIRKTESTDTAENRFIKHALQMFLYFCENCKEKFVSYPAAQNEATLLINKLNGFLSMSFFKDISRPNSLKLNSPVLQRKSGYREVLNSWLKFDLAAKLIWNGGDHIYDAGKKNIAALYEYWLFFTLLDILKDVFDIEPKNINELLLYENNKISLNLKQGKTVALRGVYTSTSRKLNVRFYYNKSFGGGKEYPLGGSYTTTLRPDYTLSIWPTDIKESDAEIQELITHIHFDAKYKVNNFYELINTVKGEELTDKEEASLLAEEKEESKGNFNNADLLKMHAYKDAIRRTGGAYVLYPGEGKNDPFRGFHELIPGLGAFVIKPDKDESGKEALKSFIVYSR